MGAILKENHCFARVLSYIAELQQLMIHNVAERLSTYAKSDGFTFSNAVGHIAGQQFRDKLRAP